MLEVGLISLFPDMFKALEHSITGRAMKNGLLNVTHCDPRDFSDNKHQRVDDKPYGGGPGMVLQYEPLRAAIAETKVRLGHDTRVLYLSPQGRRLDHDGALQLASYKRMILIAGRYEGIDQRLIDQEIDEQWSIGDYVLSGGELAAMVLIDAVIRLLPGALGDPESAEQDSFVQGLLDHPHYTRPETIAGHTVPSVLLSGDHKAVQRWRLQQALGLTWLHRPDLLTNRSMTNDEKQLLEQFKHDALGDNHE